MKIHDKHYDVIVVGGGASGMMAAGTAAKRGKSVLLIEKNTDLGEKLKITGGGRCNITNYTIDNRELLAKYSDAEPFLHSPFSQFDVKDTFTFFEKKKLPLVTEARNRVFPQSQKAYDVYAIMKDYVKTSGTEIVYNSPVYKTTMKGNKIASVDTKDTRYTADNYVIATGGYSWPETGSTGDGFKWMEKLGHTVHPPSPDVVPLRSNDPWIKRISGTSLSFMKISFYCNEDKAFSKTGKILFTHFGLSSPLILNSSKQVNTLLKKGRVTATIDLFPDTTSGALDKRIIKLLDKNSNRQVKNVLTELIPKKIAEVVWHMTQPDDRSIKAHSFSVDERKKLRDIMKAIPVNIDGLMGMDRAVLSDGGVPLKEIDTKTMKSKVVPNLYLTGDMLHINRPSGGYSLQMCWTTGYVVGSNI